MKFLLHVILGVSMTALLGAVPNPAVPAASYESVSIVPLPVPAPKDLQAVITALEPYAGLQSQLIDCQIVLWLQQLSVTELQQLSTTIRPRWSADALSMEAQRIALPQRIKDAIASHPSLTASPEDRLTAIEAGRIQGARDWKVAVSNAKAMPEGDARVEFILGIRQSAGRAFSYAEASMIREVTEALLPSAHQINSSEEEEWMFLWPVNSIVQFAMTRSEKSRFSFARHLVENAERVCAKLEDAQALLTVFGAAAPGQSPLVPEAMGCVLAGRDSADFMQWWEKLPQNHREYAIRRGIAPLLRHDSKLIQPVLEKLTPEYVLQNPEITTAWYVHDPAAALAYLSRNPDFLKEIISWTHFAQMSPRSKSIPATLAVDLLNRYPGLDACLNLIHSFDPQKQTPADFASEILRLKDPKVRNSQLFQFAQKWGYHDGASANAWASHITDKEDRKMWIRGLFYKWFQQDPEAAAKAAEAAPELDADQRRKPQPSTRSIQPPRYVKHGEIKSPAVPTATPKPALKMRQSLAEQARPGQSPANLANLCRGVLVFSLPEIQALLEQFTADPPQDACENQVRQVLLERWAMLEPEAAARWLIYEGNGMHRKAIPLALVNLVLTNSALTVELERHLPWINPETRGMILKSLAMAQSPRVLLNSDSASIGTSAPFAKTGCGLIRLQLRLGCTRVGWMTLFRISESIGRTCHLRSAVVRFAVAWELVETALKIKGRPAHELRLRRSVHHFDRLLGSEASLTFIRLSLDTTEASRCRFSACQAELKCEFATTMSLLTLEFPAAILPRATDPGWTAIRWIRAGWQASFDAA